MVTSGGHSANRGSEGCVQHIELIGMQHSTRQRRSAQDRLADHCIRSEACGIECSCALHPHLACKSA